MLTETSTGDYPGKGGRRWFADDYFDLIVWTGQDGVITGFQLCYDKRDNERALTWTEKTGWSHERVDDGESNPTKNQTPVLVPDGTCGTGEIIGLFLAQSREIDPELRSFVIDKLRAYGGHPSGRQI